MKNRRHQSGFTLVELVVVIVILGILAAVAIPKFVSLQSDARAAKAQAAAGAVKGVSAMVHASALAKDQLGATGSVAAEGGTTINTVYGYPAAAGIGAAAGLTSADGYTVSGGTITIDGGSGTCTVVYAEPTAAGAAPTITVTTSGC